MYLKLFPKHLGRCLNNFLKKRKSLEITSEKFILNQIDCCLRSGLYFSSPNSQQQQLKWNLRYSFGKLKQKDDFQSKNEIQSQIKQWMEVNKRFLQRSISIKQNDVKSTNKQHSKGVINKYRPINTINSLILLLKEYNNSRCFLSSVISSSSKQFENRINKLILQTIRELLSTLHYMVSSLEFNLVEYQIQSNRQIQFPHLGTLISTLVDILSFYCQPKSQQFDQFIISIIQLIDLYLTSFIHIIKQPFQHLQIDDSCNKLIKIKVKYNQNKINYLIKNKYSKIEYCQEILFHKSFESNKKLPSYYQPKNNRQYNYTYSEINMQYFIFIQQQIRKIVIDSQLNGYISKLDKQIDLLIQKTIIIGDKNIYVIKNIQLYIQWIRRFQLYEDVNQKSPQILMRLQFCVKLLVEFMAYSKNNIINQLPSISFHLNYQESLIYLVYFYLMFASKLSSSKFIHNTNLKEFHFKIYDFVKAVLTGQQIFIKTNSQNNHNSSQKNPLTQSQRPKIACIQLEIFQSIIKLQNKVTNSVSMKQIFTFIDPVIKRYIKEKKYKNFPYLYLTWFYDRLIGILQLSKVENLSQFKITVLKDVISAITENKLNKLSNINRIHSIYLIIRNILELKDQLGQQSGVNHYKILHWLCSHSREQLLTQDQNELCDIFEYLLPMKSLYCDFLSIVVEVSFGQFSWEGFNKLYYYSLVFYQFQETDHKLKYSPNLDCQNPHFIHKKKIKQQQRMNMEYMRRYILNQYTAMGVRRREIPLSSYFYKILELQTPQTFYKNYFQNYGHHQ